MAYGKKHLHVSLFFAFLSIPIYSCFLIFANVFSFWFLCFPSDVQKLAKLNTFQWNLWHKKPSLSNSQLGLQVVILQKWSKWTILSGQLFIQLLFIPPLTKVRGFSCLCWTSPTWLLRRFLVRKSGTLRWHMDKTPACFLASLHFYRFLSVSLHSCFWYLSLFLLFIPLFSFRDPKTSQTGHFWMDFCCTKILPFQIPNLGSKSWSSKNV